MVTIKPTAIPAVRDGLMYLRDQINGALAQLGPVNPLVPVREVLRRRKFSDETRRRMSIAQQKRHRDKMLAAKRAARAQAKRAGAAT